jgi:hypothetical protein
MTASRSPLPQRGVAHEVGQRGDRAGVLGQRDELVRRDHAVLGVLPADQCLGAEHRTGLGVHLRLVVQNELVLVDAAAQIAGEGEFARVAAVLAGVEEQVPDAVRLRGVHRDVGPLQQFVGGVPVLGTEGGADAAGYRRPAMTACETSVLCCQAATFISVTIS